MPLRRFTGDSSPNLDNPAVPRLPMVDVDKGDELVWAEVREYELRARASRDGLPPDLNLKDLVERYREHLEQVASEGYDAGTMRVTSSGEKFVYIDL